VYFYGEEVPDAGGEHSDRRGCPLDRLREECLDEDEGKEERAEGSIEDFCNPFLDFQT
jgi:hypothetical protein